MVWLVVAIGAALAAIVAEGRKQAWGVYARLALYASLALWVWSVGGAKSFQGSETSLMGWFVFGLAALLVGEVMAQLGGRLARWSLIPVPVMAVCFARGFDVLRPDAYATVPAAILAVLVALVAGRAAWRLAKAQADKALLTEQVGLLLKVAAEGLLVYAAIYKVVDRGWLLQWAYMAAGGGLLFAASQLWYGWKKLLSQQAVPAWAVGAARELGVVLMVVAAVFVYREFL